jgi:hypothetical protein
MSSYSREEHLMSSPSILNQALVVRRPRDADARALARLAALDSKRNLDGDVLLAEVGGRPIAAIDVVTGLVAADPFVRSQDAVGVLRTRAEQLRGSAARGHSRAGRRARRAIRRLAITR